MDFGGKLLLRQGVFEGLEVEVHQAGVVGLVGGGELLVQKNAEMGVVKYSSVELTSVDLVQFANHVGGYQRAATVLAELAPSIRPERLSAVVPYTTVAALQRLGYLLEFVLEENRLANELYAVLDGKTFKRIVMRNDQPEDATATANRWRVNMNINIEIDEL